MRKIIAATIMLAVAVALGACAQLSAVESGISLVTKSIANPVTKDDLYAIEASVRIGVTALATYKQACADGAADKNCRANVAAIQKYTREIPPYLVQLRAFVKNNDQINAVNTYNALVNLYTTAKTTAANLGVNLGS